MILGNREELSWLARNSLDYLGGLAAPDVITKPFSPLHNAIYSAFWGAVENIGTDPKFAFGIPRGMAKTMEVKLIALAIILYTGIDFLLIVGSSRDRARDILSDIKLLLDSPNIISVFGNWRDGVESDNVDAMVFNFRGRSIVIKAISAQTTVRGIALNNKRPQFILMDDMQSKENAQSQEQAWALQEWMFGTLMKCKSDTGCIFFYLGNMYQDCVIEDLRKRKGLTIYTCILRNLQINPEWTSLISGAIIREANGNLRSLWEEVHPLKKLLADYRFDKSHGMEEIFLAEVQNDPTAGTLFGHLDEELVQVCEYRPELDCGQYLIIDLATDKPTRDQIVFMRFSKQGETSLVVEIVRDKLSPSGIVAKAVELAVNNQCCVIAYESVAFQYAMLSLTVEYLARFNIQDIYVADVQPRGIKKNARILSSFRQIHNGEIAFTKEAYAEYIGQARSFDPKKTTNQDDVLDCVAYDYQIHELYSAVLRPPLSSPLAPDDGLINRADYEQLQYNHLMG